MVKARTGDKILFGISDGNIERLRTGQPIRIDMGEMGFPNVEVLIFYGKDEKALYKIVEPMIGIDTKVHISDRLKGGK